MLTEIGQTGEAYLRGDSRITEGRIIEIKLSESESLEAAGKGKANFPPLDRRIPVFPVSEAIWSIALGCRGFNLCGADAVDGRPQDLFIDTTTGGNSTSRFIRGFLNEVAIMPTRPFPFHFMLCRRVVQSLPPLVISLAAKPATHRLHHIA